MNIFDEENQNPENYSNLAMERHQRKYDEEVRKICVALRMLPIEYLFFLIETCEAAKLGGDLIGNFDRFQNLVDDVIHEKALEASRMAVKIQYWKEEYNNA